jgi:hypothetical protein
VRGEQPLEQAVPALEHALRQRRHAPHQPP